MVKRAFHCTTEEAAKAIVETQTFRKGSSGMVGGGIYFAESPADARRKARQGTVILEATLRMGRMYVVPSGGNSDITFEWLQTRGRDSVCFTRDAGYEFVVYQSYQCTNIALFDGDE